MGHKQSKNKIYSQAILPPVKREKEIKIKPKYKIGNILVNEKEKIEEFIFTEETNYYKIIKLIDLTLQKKLKSRKDNLYYDEYYPENTSNAEGTGYGYANETYETDPTYYSPQRFPLTSNIFSKNISL